LHIDVKRDKFHAFPVQW